MRLQAAFLSTRVARRMFALFLLSAIAPVIAFAVVSYRQVTAELRGTATTRLKQESKALGNALVERLGQLDLELAGYLDGLVGVTAASALTRHSDNLEQRSLGLVVADHPGTWKLSDGNEVVVPALRDADLSRLESGAPLVQGSPAGVFLVRQFGPSTRVWLAIEPAFLLTGQSRESRSEPPDGACVYMSDGTSVACTAEVTDGLIRATADPGGLTRWTEGKEHFLAATTPLFLNYLYGSADWMVSQVASERSIIAPVGKFRNTFLLVGLLTIWTVILVTQVQIRRGLQPIEALRAGTERVARQQFDEPVVVQTGDEFENLATSFNSMSDHLQRQFATLTAINLIDRVTLGNNDRWRVLSSIVEHGRTIVTCDALEIGVPADAPGAWEWIRANPDSVEIDQTTLLLNELDMIQSFARQEEVALPQGFPGRDREHWTESLGLPIVHGGVVVALVILRIAPGRSHGIDVGDARRLRDHIGVALANLRLLSELNDMTEGALLGLARAIDAKSPWTSGHSERVTQISLELGAILHLSTEELDLLHRGGLLHDIGKIGIPGEILDKAGPLTPEEKTTMDSHTVVGENILSPIGPFGQMLPIVRSHHERWDGGGYPDGLAGEEIHLLARVLAVADVYDAMRSERPYRPGWAKEDTVAMIREGAGSHFDARVVAAFLEWTESEPADMYARVNQNASLPVGTHPMFDAAG